MTDLPTLAQPKPSSRTTPAIERERAKQREITFKTIETEHENTLVERRQACAVHDVYQGLQNGEARGKPQPSASEVCLKVLDVTAKQGRESHLYQNLALQAQGRLEFETELDNELLKNGEATKTFLAIGRAALAGKTSYLSIREDLPEEQRTKPLYCPLALDNGFSYGSAIGKKPLQVLSPAARKAAVEACYDPASPPTITIDGEVMPLNKAGLLAGENIGRETRLKLDAVKTPSEKTGSITPPPKAAENVPAAKAVRR